MFFSFYWEVWSVLGCYRTIPRRFPKKTWVKFGCLGTAGLASDFAPTSSAADHHTFALHGSFHRGGEHFTSEALPGATFGGGVQRLGLKSWFFLRFSSGFLHFSGLVGLVKTRSFPVEYFIFLVKNAMLKDVA